MGTTLFENDLTAAVEALKTQAGNRWRVPEGLLSYTMKYYQTHAQSVREHLNKAAKFWGFSEQAQNALLEDYARALFGVFDFTASREQMEQLRALRSSAAFFIDPYGLYIGVLGGYSDVYRRLLEYDIITVPREQYHGGADLWDVQRAYINGPNYLAQGRAISYLIRWGQFDAGQFAAVAGPSEVSAFLDRCQMFAAVYDYATYYTICKYCLNATAADLAQIPTPRDTFGDKTPQQFAEETGATITAEVERLRGMFSDLLAAPTEAKAQAAAEQMKTERGEIVRVSDTFAALLSRDVYGSKNGEHVRNENDILPIQSFIVAYMDKHPDAIGNTTPRIVEKAIEGVNLLQRKQRVTPVNGLFTFKTNISEFATLCGYTDANDDEKRALLLALRVLNGLYLAVWRPRGLSAVNVLNVREIGLTGGIRGNLVIDVTAEAMVGSKYTVIENGKKVVKLVRPQLLTFGDIQRMRREAKGYAENHFRYQIIGKGHKTEQALLDEIFGYTNAIREATETGATAEVLDGLRRNQQKHKPRDRARLLRMFEREEAAGFLTYRKYTNAKGETVYSWQRTDTAQPQDPDGPDEQKQPE